MYEVLYGVPPSMLTAIDCEEEELGVLPEKAIAIPTNPSLTLLNYLKEIEEHDVPSKDTSNVPNVEILANAGYVVVPPYQAFCELTVQF